MHDEVYKIELSDITIQPRASFLLNGGADLLYSGKTRIECARTGLVAEVQFSKKVGIFKTIMMSDIKG